MDFKSLLLDDMYLTMYGKQIKVVFDDSGESARKVRAQWDKYFDDLRRKRDPLNTDPTLAQFHEPTTPKDDQPNG